MWSGVRVLVGFLATAVLVESSLGIGVEVEVDGLGTVIGKQETTSWTGRDLYAFRGIPYAKPPTGSLRFQPPVKVDSWNGTLNATTFGNVCPQNPSLGLSGDDEDCLTLNIYVPETNNDTTTLPVMIFIHGGNFMSGYASLYQGHYLAEKDVIIVVPQFRLGPLGLLSLQTDEIPGNVQFLDQIMAMQWVQDNIAAFGGNPDQVTLFGQSAGAVTVNLHQFSPLSTGLFHRAIIMSGSAFVPWGIDRSPVQSAMNLGAFVGCTQTNLTELATCYKELAVQTILDGYDAYEAAYSLKGLTAFGGSKPVIQTAGKQKFLVEEPTTLLKEARYNHVPMIGGATKQDGSFLLASLYTGLFEPYALINDESFLRYNLTEFMVHYVGEKDLTGDVSQSMEFMHYVEADVGDFMDMAPGLVDICTVFLFKSPVFRMMKMNSRLTSSYLYTFNYRGKYSVINYSTDVVPFSTGVAHGDDVLYLFPLVNLPAADIVVAKRLVSLWTSFAINGVPTADNVTWDAMSTQVGPYLLNDDEASEHTNYLSQFVISEMDGLS